MSDINQFKKALTGLAIGLDTDATPTEAEGGPIDQMTDFVVTERLPADGAASTAIAATKLWVNPFQFPVRIVRALVSSDAAVAADGTNYGALALSVDDGANGAPAAAAAVNNNTDGAWSADVAKVMTLTGGNCVVAPGACIFYAQTKTGTGTQYGARTLTLRLRRI